MNIEEIFWIKVAGPLQTDSESHRQSFLCSWNTFSNGIVVAAAVEKNNNNNQIANVISQK